MCRMSSGLKSSQQEGNSMIAYQSTLLGRTEVAEDTMAFRFETLQRRDFVILSFCSTRTATWKMLRPWMHSGSWSGLIPGSGLFLPSRASPKNYRGWKGETGHISPEMLSTHISNLRGAIYYIAVPPMMVEAARETLNEVGVDEDDIRTEEFAGY